MATVISRSTDAVTVVPDQVQIFEDDVTPGTVVHDAIGLTYPEVTLRPAKSPTGVLKMFFLTHEAAHLARAFHMAAATFSIVSETMPWLPANFVPQGSIRRVQQEESSRRWVLAVGYRELAP